MSQDQRAGELSLFALLAVLLRQRRVLVGVPLLVGLAASGLWLLRGKEYVAESRFVPQSADAGIPGVAGFAAQLGFAIPGGSRSESPEFYAELAKSRELLRALAVTTLRVAVAKERTDSLEGTVIELYGIEGRTAEDRERAAIEVLSRRVSASVSIRTGLVTLRSTAPHPDLAVKVNRRLLELLNAYNMETRQSQAATERRFVEERMREAQAELLAAEGDLQGFLRRNRSYRDSPQLAFEAARLERRVALHQQVYTALAQSYEQARIEEVRNTPVITIVDPPERSARHVGGSLVVELVVALALGVALGIMIAFAREYLARQRREDPAGHSQLAALWTAAAADLWRLVRVARPARRGASAGAHAADQHL